MRWVLVAIIGILTGAIAFVISICVEKLVDLKYTQFEKGIHAVRIGFGYLYASVSSYIKISHLFISTLIILQVL